MYNVHTHKQRQGLPFSPFILVLTIPGPGNIFLSESRQFKIGLVWTFGRKWHWTAGIMTIPCTLRPNDDGGHLLFQFPFILRPPEVRWGKEAEHGDDFGSFSGLCSFFVSGRGPTTSKAHHHLESWSLLYHCPSSYPEFIYHILELCCSLGATSKATEYNSIILWEQLWLCCEGENIGGGLHKDFAPRALEQ